MESNELVAVERNGVLVSKETVIRSRTYSTNLGMFFGLNANIIAGDVLIVKSTGERLSVLEIEKPWDGERHVVVKRM